MQELESIYFPSNIWLDGDDYDYFGMGGLMENPPDVREPMQ